MAENAPRSHRRLPGEVSAHDSTGRAAWGGWTLLRLSRAARTVLCLAALLGVALLAGCYQPDSGDPDEAAGALGSGARQDPGPDAGHAGTTGTVGETDEQVERRGLTAFVGAESRGQYLTEQVAMCVQCHSPKDDAGRVIPERKFQGAPIPVVSPYGAREWAVEAPALAGLESYDRDAFVRLLTEGIARDGEPPRPPMPPFRMNAEDAGAIYDYLSGLPWD